MAGAATAAAPASNKAKVLEERNKERIIMGLFGIRSEADDNKKITMGTARHSRNRNREIREIRGKGRHNPFRFPRILRIPRFVSFPKIRRSLPTTSTIAVQMERLLLIPLVHAGLQFSQRPG
jgi:hypothetical protein